MGENMKKIIQILIINLAIISLSACSLAPGVPGLKTSSSRYAKPQKEGVDYKLIIINADSIRNQKTFDYAAYVRDRKRRTDVYGSQTRSNSSNNAVSNKNVRRVNNASNNSRVKQQAQSYNATASTKMARFEGVTSRDDKANYQYYIGRGDVLNITVWDHPELTNLSENNAYGGHTVGNDGSFFFPYSGKIKAVGKTIRTIRDELERKLGSFITKPQVSLSISNFRSQKVFTSGAIANPTTLMINDTPTTVRDAISKSGGLKPNQYTGYATLARNGRNISIDLNQMLKRNNNRQNFILKNGDRLHIVERTELAEFNRNLNLQVRTENTLSTVRLRNDLVKERSIARLKKELERELRSEQAKVFVMGEVQKPGSVKYQIEDGMTLAEALNDAGSLKEDSVDPKGIFVVRKESKNDNIPTVYQLPMASVQSIFLAEEFEIRPRDTVYVTAMPSIRWNRVLAQLLPSLAIVNAFK